MSEKIPGADEASIHFSSVVVDEAIAEQVRAAYLAPDARIENPWYVYRINAGGRFYIKVDEDLLMPTAASVTTILGRYMPESPQLTEWKVKHGEDKAKRLAREAADYGTWFHIALARLVDGQPFNFSDKGVQTALDNYVEEAGIDYQPPKDWAEKIRPDLMALVRWAQEWKFKPLAVEIPVWFSGKLSFAGVVDLVGWVTKPLTGKEKQMIREKRKYLEEYVEIVKDRKKMLESDERLTSKQITKWQNRQGKLKEYILKRRFPTPRPFLVIVDLKSGRKGFWDEHAIQLRAYRFAWNWEHGSEYFVRRTFNLAPNGKDPRNDTQPYNFTEQTNHSKGHYWLNFLRMFHKDNKGKTMRLRTEYKDVDVTLATDLATTVDLFDPVERMRESVIADKVDDLFDRSGWPNREAANGA